MATTRLRCVGIIIIHIIANITLLSIPAENVDTFDHVINEVIKACDSLATHAVRFD